MKRSTNRILTTHVGSLPRPADVIEMITAKDAGKPYDHEVFAMRVRSAVAESVRNQVDSKVDIVSDGELSKPSFSSYVRGRMNGLNVTNEPGTGGNQDLEFPGFQAWRAANGRGPAGGGAFNRRAEVVGPLTFKGQADVQTDIANLKAALGGVRAEEAFIPSASVGIISRIDNKYYPTYDAYIRGIADVMKHEYEAIAKAGFILQIDAPEMVLDKHRPENRDKPLSDYIKNRMEPWVEALNYAMGNIPQEQIRFHICWGNQEGPHTRDIPLKDVVDVMLKVKAQAYSVEASNPRHAYEWKVWKDTKLAPGKVLIPGTIDTTTNFVEHPETVADRVVKYAGVAGRESVIASTDCGFGTSATWNLVYTPIVWAKLKSMGEGAALATKQLWR